MKKWMAVSVMASSLLSCAASKYRIEPNFPPAMSAEVKVGYMEQWEKGRVLYGLTCGKCHNTRKGKYEIIPDFKPEQLVGYELRVKNAKHETGIPDEIVTTEELAQIMIFLNYKKQRG
jgi:hypothetical protein